MEQSRKDLVKAADAGPGNVFTDLVEVEKENWSLGQDVVQHVG
jgi:hypothetical protein